jgi:acyl carrier protein
MSAKSKILVLDDEREITESLEGYFQSKGYEIFTALSGEKAIQILAEYKPDVAFLDIKMEGINGIDILKTIKNIYPDMKTIVITGATEEYRDDLKTLKPDLVLSKPISISLLTKKIEELLEVEKEVAEKEKTQEPSAKLKLLFVEGNDLVYSWFLLPHFSKFPWQNNFILDIATGDEEAILQKAQRFKPDIILLNTTTLSNCRDLSLRLEKIEHTPKDVILHGISLDSYMDVEVPGSFFDKNYFAKLDNAIIQSLIRHDLLSASIKFYENKDDADIMEEQVYAGEPVVSTADELEKMVYKIIRQQLGLDSTVEVASKTRLAEDLGVDSLDTVELIIAFEDYFKIEVKDEEVEGLKTVGNIIAYIQQNIKNSPKKKA